MDVVLRTVLVGIGATATMDLWSVVARRLFAMPSSNWALVGRWIGHLPRGRFRHVDIAKAEGLPGERVIGWSAHYVIGIAFAALLVLIAGPAWLATPTVGAALLAGLCTLIAPFFVMQPAMGYGIASAHARNPTAARLRSFANHAVFGLGLYASALVIAAATDG